MQCVMLFIVLSCTVLISQDRNAGGNSCLNKLVWLIFPTGINISAALSLLERYLHHKGIILSRSVKFEVLVAHTRFLSKLLSWTETSQRNKLLSHHITVICIRISIFLSFCSYSLNLFQTCGEYDTDLYPADFTSKKRSEFPWYNLVKGGKTRACLQSHLNPCLWRDSTCFQKSSENPTMRQERIMQKNQQHTRTLTGEFISNCCSSPGSPRHANLSLFLLHTICMFCPFVIWGLKGVLYKWFVL